MIPQAGAAPAGLAILAPPHIARDASRDTNAEPPATTLAATSPARKRRYPGIEPILPPAFRLRSPTVPHMLHHHEPRRPNG